MTDGTVFQAPGRKFWKARALALFLFVSPFLGAGYFVYAYTLGYIEPMGLLILLLAALIVGSFGYFGSFVLVNRVAMTTTHVAPPSKPLWRLRSSRLVIPWRDVTAIEETQPLHTGPAEFSYVFTIRTKDGRRYPFRALHLAWLTESTAEMRRAYEMMKAISEAFGQRRLDRLDENPGLMSRLTDLQRARFPDLDLFSRTLASKLAMAVGGPMFLAGLILVLLDVPANPWVKPTLWIVGGLFFGLGLSTKRAFAHWGGKTRSTRSRG